MITRYPGRPIGSEIRETAHYIAHQEAHRAATSAARKVTKAIKYLYGFDHKLVRDTVYRSSYEALYRDRFQEELIDLILQQKTADQKHLTEEDYALAVDAGRDMHALFGIEPEDRA
jgi:hypothetical protein